MKKLVYAGALFALVSCGGGEDAAEDILANLDEALEEVATDETAVEETTTEETVTEEAVAGTWSAWAETYNAGYDMMDGNPELDGSSVTLEGVIEQVTDWENMDGESGIIACFGAGEFGKCAVSAIFPEEAREALNAAKDAGTLISFTGTVNKKSFDEIKIKDCTIN